MKVFLIILLIGISIPIIELLYWKWTLRKLEKGEKEN